MPDTTIRVAYSGATDRYSELAITGNQQVWVKGQTAYVEPARAALLVASGQFSYPADDLDMRYKQTAAGPSLSGDAAGAVRGAAEGLAGVLTPYTEDSFITTVFGIAKAGAGRVETVTCTQGTGIVVTLYDNTQAASGSVIWTGTMSAGDVVAPPNALFTNGCYVSYSGTATFIINHTEDI